ncbi:class I SAM-dependent methyltransferase [Singulisphaera sp. PoT]|uniref:class I SAM-dependent methyltransferase n=1 Tax=Singulisphaera sp. PoT TaxID=3411797 RepID=UPI003BF4AD50
MPYRKEEAAREFAVWSKSYDRSILQWLLFTPSHEALIARLRDRFGDRPWSLLDVGCGTGVFAARVRDAFPLAKVWGVDLVAAMIQAGRLRPQPGGQPFAAVQGDSERLPFAAGSFDMVTCSNSFHHYPHQDRAVAEMSRVLKPGGRLMLLDGHRDGYWGRFIYDVCVAGIEGEVHHASASRVRELFRRAGFARTDQEVHSGLAPFLLTEGRMPPAEPLRVPAREKSAAMSSPDKAEGSPDLNVGRLPATCQESVLST